MADIATPDLAFGRPALTRVRDVAKGMAGQLPIEPWRFSEAVDGLLVAFGPYTEANRDMAKAFFAGAIAAFIHEWAGGTQELGTE